MGAAWDTGSLPRGLSRRENWYLDKPWRAHQPELYPRSCSQIPVPTCLGCFKSGRRTYFFMSRADGVTLESMWPLLSVDHKTSIQGQLNSIFTALRSTPLPPVQAKLETGAIKFGNFLSTTCKHMRRQARVSKVPITSEVEFNDFLCHRPRRPVENGGKGIPVLLT